MKHLCVLVMVCVVLFPLPAKGGKVAVVLGGGGARGYAEVALLEKLEAYGIPVDMVLGTSIGALIGSMYATGYTPSQIAGYVQSHNILDIVLKPVSPRVPTFSGPQEKHNGNIISLSFGNHEVGEFSNISEDHAVLAMMNELYGSKAGITDFDQLDIPFRAVATDALTGERIVYDHGSLVTAVRSSLSIPLVFAPYPQEDGSYAMDGGMVDNLPIDLARELGADYVIAMDVSPNAKPTRKDMQNFLGVAGRLLAIMTPSMEYQYPNADILIVPDIENNMQTMLAFDKFSDMYVAGKKAVDAHEEEFRKLAWQLRSDGRDLVPKDPDRPQYWNEDERAIRSVEVHDRSKVEHAFVIGPEAFHFMLGEKLDEKNRQRLLKYLERVKYNNKLSSISYDVRHDDNPYSETLLINYEYYDIPSNRFQLSAYGSLGFSNNNYVSDTPMWMGFQFRETFLFSEVTKHKFDFSIDLRQGTVSSLVVGAWVPLMTTNSHQIAMGIEGMAGIGSYSIQTHDANSERLSPIDHGGDLRVGLAYNYANFLQLELLAGLRNAYVHEQKKQYNMGYGSIGLVIDTRIHHSMIENGVRFSVKEENGISVPDDFFWSLQGDFRQDAVLSGGAHMVGYGFRFDMLDGPDGLDMSYADIGGFDGMPGYRYGTLRRSSALAMVRYRMRLPVQFLFPVYFVSRGAGGVMDDYEPFKGEMEGAYFHNRNWDIGLEAGVGMQTPLGNWVALFGYSADGKTSFSIGIIE